MWTWSWGESNPRNAILQGWCCTTEPQPLEVRCRRKKCSLRDSNPYNSGFKPGASAGWAKRADGVSIGIRTRPVTLARWHAAADIIDTLEQVGGFEPPNSPWKGAMLPLTSYLHWEDRALLALPAGASRPACSRLSFPPVPAAGIEPTLNSLSASRSQPVNLTGKTVGGPYDCRTIISPSTLRSPGASVGIRTEP